MQGVHSEGIPVEAPETVVEIPINIATVVWVLGSVVLWGYFGVPWDALTFHSWQIAAGLAAGFALIAVLQAIALLPESWWKSAEDACIANETGSGAGDILASTVAAITEEIFFRGSLQVLLAPVIGIIGAIALTNVLFSAAHFKGGLSYIVLAALVGLCLGALFAATGSLITAIIAHAVVNLVACVVRLNQPEHELT